MANANPLNNNNITTFTINGGNLQMDNTTSATDGIIKFGANNFISNFGTSNTFVGASSGNITTSGTGLNTGMGAGVLSNLTTGSSNTAIGASSLAAVTTGASNTAVGQNSLNANTGSSDNTAIGFQALQANTTSFNT